MKTPFLFILIICSLIAGCASMRSYQALDDAERKEYVEIAPKMTVRQRQEYLAQGTTENRREYLKSIGLHDEVVRHSAFQRLERERQNDFLKNYLTASSDDLNRMLATYDENTRDRIAQKDLQYGWTNQQVLLSLGNPDEILESAGEFGKNQLWIYDHQQVATYLYFENGQPFELGEIDRATSSEICRY